MMFQPTGRREIAENVLTAVLCAAATALLDAGIKAVERKREERREQAEGVERAEKKRRKGKKS